MITTRFVCDVIIIWIDDAFVDYIYSTSLVSTQNDYIL